MLSEIQLMHKGNSVCGEGDKELCNVGYSEKKKKVSPLFGAETVVLWIVIPLAP